jgi:hypothetical protein
MNAFCFDEERKGRVENKVSRGGLEDSTLFAVSRTARENWVDNCGAKTYAQLPSFVEMIRVGLYGREASTGDAPRARREIRRILVKSLP